MVKGTTQTLAVALKRRPSVDDRVIRDINESSKTSVGMIT